MAKDLWNRKKINKKLAYDILSRIRKADPEAPNTRQTLVMGKVDWLRRGVENGDIWLYRDWDELNAYVDTVQNNVVLVAFMDKLYDVLMLADLKADNDRRHREVRERVERNKA